MSCTGDCNCVPLTSTVGPKGDTGATGATGATGPAGAAGAGLTLQNHNVEVSAGTDTYNAGNGLDLTLIASKTVGGSVYYWGEVSVDQLDTGIVTVTPKLNGVADATKATVTTLPVPHTGGQPTYAVIPISGTMTVPLGQSLKINVLGQNLTPLLISANITFIEL